MSKGTLPLFADELLPASPQPTTPSLPAHWPPAKRENFTWWCQHGNTEMCAAVLWQSEGFAPGAAASMVKAQRQHIGAHIYAAAYPHFSPTPGAIP